MYSERDLLFNIPDDKLLSLAKGGFSKRVFVAVLNEPDSPGNISFLSKILTAAGLNLEKDTLFAELTADRKYSFLPLIKEKQVERILVFGLPKEYLGLNTNCPMYQPFYFYGATFLFADRLSLLEPDKNLKTKLWQALQQLFL